MYRKEKIAQHYNEISEPQSNSLKPKSPKNAYEASPETKTTASFKYGNNKFITQPDDRNSPKMKSSQPTETESVRTNEPLNSQTSYKVLKDLPTEL